MPLEYVYIQARNKLPVVLYVEHTELVGACGRWHVRPLLLFGRQSGRWLGTGLFALSSSFGRVAW